MPMDADVSPLPSELTTPPVTKMCRVIDDPQLIRNMRSSHREDLCLASLRVVENVILPREGCQSHKIVSPGEAATALETYRAWTSRRAFGKPSEVAEKVWQWTMNLAFDGRLTRTFQRFPFCKTASRFSNTGRRTSDDASINHKTNHPWSTLRHWPSRTAFIRPVPGIGSATVRLLCLHSPTATVKHGHASRQAYSAIMAGMPASRLWETARTLDSPFD
jgi:hypothetical protein